MLSSRKRQVRKLCYNHEENRKNNRKTSFIFSILIAFLADKGICSSIMFRQMERSFFCAVVGGVLAGWHSLWGEVHDHCFSSTQCGVSRSRRDLLYVCPECQKCVGYGHAVGTCFMHVRLVPTVATFAAPPFLAFVRTCCRDLLYACPLSPYGRNVNAFANA